jgi:hypothetical protein
MFYDSGSMISRCRPSGVENPGQLRGFIWKRICQFQNTHGKAHRPLLEFVPGHKKAKPAQSAAGKRIINHKS